jgi:hypothetical protein
LFWKKISRILKQIQKEEKKADGGNVKKQRLETGSECDKRRE